MHDNHQLQSTVAYQNTGQTVLSRRATALLRRLRISLQSALEINLRIHAMRAYHTVGPDILIVYLTPNYPSGSDTVVIPNIKCHINVSRI